MENNYNLEGMVSKRSSAVKTGIIYGAALTAAALVPSVAYAAPEAAEAMYGFGSGLIDGLLVPINFTMDLFGAETTLAQDGTGTISEPNTGFGYWAGFVITAGLEGSVLGIFGGDD